MDLVYYGRVTACVLALAGICRTRAENTSAASARRVLCWGDSVTEGMAMPRGKDYPSRLQALLGQGYEVLNSGDGGENTVTIPARQGAVPLATAAEIKFAAGESAVQVGDASDNGFHTPSGDVIKLTAALGRQIPVNPVRIGDGEFTLFFRDFRWNSPTNKIGYTLWLKRGESDAGCPLAIPAGSPVKFASADAAPGAYCEIFFMGANGGWDRKVEKLVAQIRAMVARRGEDRPYLVIVPYWKGFPQKDREFFKAAFGRRAVEFPVADALCYRNRPDVHLNANGYALLAELLHARGAELGYWPRARGAESAEEVFATLRAKADARIAEIRAAPNRTVPEAAPKRFLSEKGDDAADGTTPQTAWKTIARLNREKLAPGAYVLFARGGLYRGCVAVQPGVTYTAYGQGPKPAIYGSPEDGADPAKWERTDNPRVWAYAIGHDDVGTLVFDGGAAHAIKIVIRTDKKTGAKFNKFTGRPFNSYRDLDGDLHFWHDYYKDGTGKLYLCSERNPGERFKSIEFNVKTCGFRVGGAAGVTIENFTVKYVGVHGVSAGTCRNLTVRDCEFGWIGGSIQAEGIYGRDYPTRLGNAVEVYGGCDGYVVENCYIWQVYDAGVTHQLNIPKKYGMKRFDQKNVRYSRNVMEKCNYSIEYFLTAYDGNPSRMENVLFEDNLMFDAGYGFCEQRPDRGCASHIKAWRSPFRNRATNYVIRNNAMCFGQDVLIQACSGLKNLDGSSSLPTLEGNVFVGRAGDLFGAISETSGKSLTYGPDTQAFVDTFGKGNRCYFKSADSLAVSPGTNKPNP